MSTDPRQRCLGTKRAFWSLDYCPNRKNYLNNYFRACIGNLLPELIVRTYLSVIFYHWKRLKLIGRITRNIYLIFQLPKTIVSAPPQSVINYRKYSENNKFPAGNYYELDSIRWQKTQTFFVHSFSTTLRVMDVRAEKRGRPHQKVRFPAAPVGRRNFLTPGHSGVRVRNVCGKSGPKSLCLCCFFFPAICSFKKIFGAF